MKNGSKKRGRLKGSKNRSRKRLQRKELESRKYLFFAGFAIVCCTITGIFFSITHSSSDTSNVEIVNEYSSNGAQTPSPESTELPSSTYSQLPSNNPSKFPSSQPFALKLITPSKIPSSSTFNSIDLFLDK